MSGSITPIPDIDVDALLAMHVGDLLARIRDELNIISTVKGRGAPALRQAAADKINAYSEELDRRLKASEAARESAVRNFISADAAVVRGRRDINEAIDQVSSALQMADAALDLSYFLGVHLDFIRHGEHVYRLTGHSMLEFTLDFAVDNNPYGTISTRNKLTGGRSYTYSLGHGGLQRDTFLIIGGLCGHMVTEENLPPRLRSQIPSDTPTDVVALLRGHSIGAIALVRVARRPL